MPRFDMGPPVYEMPSTATANASNGTMPQRVVIDGTPIRIVMLAAAGAAGIVMLRWAGFKFNVAI